MRWAVSASTRSSPSTARLALRKNRGLLDGLGVAASVFEHPHIQARYELLLITAKLALSGHTKILKLDFGGKLAFGGKFASFLKQA